MAIQNKLTFQFDNKASFKLDGKKIDLEKNATEQVVLGKDGKEKTIKGFKAADGLIYSMKKTQDGKFKISVYGEPEALAKQRFSVRGGDISGARFGDLRLVNDKPGAGTFSIDPGSDADRIGSFAKTFGLHERANLDVGAAPTTGNNTATVLAEKKRKEKLEEEAQTHLKKGPQKKASENDEPVLSVSTGKTTAINDSVLDSASSSSSILSPDTASSTAPDTSNAKPSNGPTSATGEARTDKLSGGPQSPSLAVRDENDSDLYALMDEIAAAKAEMTRWLGANTNIKSTIEKGLDERLALVEEELTLRHQIIDLDAPVTDETIAILKAQKDNSWIRHEASDLATQLESLGQASLDDYLKTSRKGRDAIAKLEELRHGVIRIATSRFEHAERANSNRSGLSVPNMLSSVNRKVQDVKGDGHCQFHSFAHAEGKTDFNSVGASDDQRKALLKTLASLSPDQARLLAESSLVLADTYRILRLGMGQDTVGSGGWGRREHLQLKAIQAKRPVVAFTPGSAVICQPDGHFSELKDKPSIDAALAQMKKDPEPLYILHNGQDHWQSTVAN